MTFYVVLDTNVLVSALLTKDDDSATVFVLKKLLSGRIVALYNSEIIKEYTEVLSRPKFNFKKERIEYLLGYILSFGISVDSSPSDIVLPDIKDVPFFSIVLEKRNDNAYLVTGNTRHFPRVSFVVTPREFLDILETDEIVRERKILSDSLVIR